MTLGVETGVLGLGLAEITERQRAEVVVAHPHPDLRNRVLKAFLIRGGPWPE